MKKRYFVGATLSLMLTGCQAITWTEVSPFVSQRAPALGGFPETAVVLQTYQTNQEAMRNPGSLLGGTRNYQHQVMLEGASGQRPLTTKRPGKDAPGTLYYLQEAGYVMLGVTQPGSGVDKVRYEKINLSDGQASLIRHAQGGEQVSLCQNRAPAFVVEELKPAPDGKVLAHVFSQVCGIAKVEFLNPIDFSVRDHQEIQVDSPSQTEWTTDGLTIYAVLNPDQRWLIRPSQAPMMKP